MGTQPFGDDGTERAVHVVQEADALLDRLDEAVRGRDQGAALAVARRYADLGHDTEAFLARMLHHSVEADGALHAEKYYGTASAEIRRARPAFRGRHVAALARVCASQAGFEPPGHAQALELLRTS